MFVIVFMYGRAVCFIYLEKTIIHTIIDHCARGIIRRNENGLNEGD